MQDSLVAASAEFQGEIFFGFDELAVYKGIDAGEHLVSVFGVDFSARDEVYIIEISGVAPDIFLRVAFFDLLQESCEFFLILWLEGFAAQHGQAVDKGLVQLGENLPLRVGGEGPAEVEVPGLGLEAVGAVVGAAGDEQRHPDSGSVGDITFFQGSVVHDMVSFR